MGDVKDDEKYALYGLIAVPVQAFYALRDWLKGKWGKAS